MLLAIQTWALDRARVKRSRTWLHVFDVLRVIDLAWSGLPADARRT